MYKKVDTNLNFVEREQEVLKFWKENDVFEKSIQMNEGKEVFTFYDGPPTANGMPHIGHVLTRAIKDLIPRYKTMKGYKVLRKAGWDTHGLPVELEIEKNLGINGKPEIEKYGVEPFIEKCKESVWKYEQEWREMSDMVGYWADMDDPYVTYEDDYIESVWWALKTIWDKGLIYKGHKVIPYCPRCGTSLSSHEVAQGYKDVVDKSAFAKFKCTDEENTYYLAWTTTPWTLPSNVALIVNADEDYVKVDYNGQFLILAAALKDKVLGEEYTIVKTFKGSELEHREYEPLFNYATVDKKAFFVGCDDYVTLTDGTGIVHTAPAFGEDDARIGRKYDLPFVQLVDDQGKFVECVTDWAGVFVKDADQSILDTLAEQGKLFKAENYEHSYPYCWRCDTPLIYYARSTWFIEMSKMRDKLVANNNTVNWIPETIKQGRFGNFLENVIDWGVSRERYWGTPLPIWECECGHRHTVGSKAELKEMSNDCPDNIELHKPYVDNVHLNCPKCNGTMTRVSEVIDCWFDSGAMPFAQWHYPFENKDIFEENFPANFISEAVDQTRGWFYTLMAISTLLFDRAPYENVVVLGHVLDANGLKMSKSKGNAVDPKQALTTQGADAVRWYFYANSSPWLPSRYSEEAVNEGQRKFMGTLWNTYAFFILYANIDEFDYTKYSLEFDKLDVMDKWILSKLNTLIETVDSSLNQYKITESARALNAFVDELSNWYVRRSRERFWVSEMPQDKINAYMTLHTVLVSLSKLAAPYIPFMTDEMYRNLVCSVDKNAPISVHLCEYPVCDKKFVDEKLEKNMDLVLKIVTLGRSGRNEANIKNRQPISVMYVKSNETLDSAYLPIIQEELNLKSVEFINDDAKFTSYSFKPQLKTLGPKYGKLLGGISKLLQQQDGNEFMAALQNGTVTLMVDDNEVVLSLEDVLVSREQVEGYMAQSEADMTVVLDTDLSPELLEEGLVRELISKIQTMRKESGFEVLDKIKLYIDGNEKIATVVNKNADYIKSEVLALEIIEELAKPVVKEWNINGENVVISISL